MAKTPAKKPSRKSTSAAAPKAASAHNERMEWIVAGLSAMLVIALTGYIAFEAVTRSGGTPDIAVQVGEIYQMETGYGVNVTVINTSSVTVASVEIEATSSAETSSFTLDYLPANSEVEAGLGFATLPESATLSVRVVGFVYP